MTDHIVVFEGHPRLTGQILPVHIEDASALTLFGSVITREQVGVAQERYPGSEVEVCHLLDEVPPAQRISLPLV